jgi:hypothetical protein
MGSVLDKKLKRCHILIEEKCDNIGGVFAKKTTGKPSSVS